MYFKATYTCVFVLFVVPARTHPQTQHKLPITIAAITPAASFAADDAQNASAVRIPVDEKKNQRVQLKTKPKPNQNQTKQPTPFPLSLSLTSPAATLSGILVGTRIVVAAVVASKASVSSEGVAIVAANVAFTTWCLDHCMYVLCVCLCVCMCVCVCVCVCVRVCWNVKR